MPTVRYSIHNLIDVYVDTGVSGHVMQNIDFQVGFFKTGEEEPPAHHRIDVKPYEDFIPDKSLSFDTFHLVRGVKGRCLDDPEGRVAFEKEGKGYRIYADAPNWQINFFIQVLLMEHGITMTHAAAAADRSGRVTLMPGPGGVGKTAILGHMVKDKNCTLLGDDIVGINDGGECLAFPRSFVLKRYHGSVYPEVFERLNIEKERKEPFSSRVKRFTWENAPFVGLARAALRRLGLLEWAAQRLLPPPVPPYLATVPVEDIFGEGSVAAKGTIERIIFLERYEGAEFRIGAIGEEDLCRRMFAIIHHEWVAFMRHIFSMGAMEIIDLPAYFRRVDSIMRSAVSGKRCEILSIPEGATPEELAAYFASLEA